MKNIFSLFLTCFLISTATSQIEVVNVIKPSLGECNGKIVLSFIASEIPGTLIITPSNQGQSGGMVTIESTKHTLSDLCAGDYTFTFRDNHSCSESIFESIEACGDLDLDFNVKTDIVNCNLESPFSIEPDFENYEDYYFEWSTGSIEHSIEVIPAGTYNVTIYDGFGCTQVVEKTITPIELEEDLEIIPTKIEMAHSGNSGIIEIEVDGGYPPFQINWSATDPAAINTVAADGMSATLNKIDFYSDVTISIVDKYGCTKEKTITLETCFGMNEEDFDVFYNPFELKKCSDVFEGEMHFDIQMISSFINYEISKLNDNTSWEVLKEGVVEHSASFLSFMYTDSGKYKIFFWDECGFTYEREINLVCKDDEVSCLGVNDLVHASSYDADDECDPEYHALWFELWKLHKYCIENGNQALAFCDDPIEVLIKFSDGGIYRVSANEIDLYNVETIVESENVYIHPGSKNLIFEGNPDETHSVQVSLNNGCIYQETLDVRTLEDMNTVWFAGIGNFNGIKAQCVNVKCETCKYQIKFSEDFYDYSLQPWEPGWNYTPFEKLCDDPYFSAFRFYPDFPDGAENWDPNSNLTPFDLGGKYKVTIGNLAFQEVNIPAGTPYVMLSAEEGLSEHSSPKWIRCIYAAGYASHPAYNSFPIYVAYSEEAIESWIAYTIEPPTILEEDCEDEWVTTSVEYCKQDVMCLDNIPSTLIGTIADETSLIPCKLETSTGCIVIGYCTESQDYYYDDDGEYFVFEDLSCDDENIMDCIENSNNEPPIDCDEDHPCPDGQFCLHEMCRDCPTYSFVGIYGNNTDCFYDFEISFEVDVAIFNVLVKTYTIGPDNVEVYDRTYYMDFGPGGLPQKIKVEIPSGCISTNVKVTLEYKTCEMVEVFTTESVQCENDCFGNNNDIEYSLITNETNSPIRKEKISKQSDLVASTIINGKDCTLYPNPFFNTFKVESKSKIIKSAIIINVLGERVIMNEKILSYNYGFDLSLYTSGIYFVKVIFEDGSKKEFKALKINN